MKQKNTKLIEIIKNRGLSIAELAKRVGVERTTMYRIINNERTLTYDMACKIAKELQATPDALFFLDHSK